MPILKRSLDGYFKIVVGTSINDWVHLSVRQTQFITVRAHKL